ncbi:nicotinate-nucleotide--dimethylbenzimidazole phosphoribosyltransferase [Nocardioides euryhalodurans]|uniref:Nicotinate-nucleotide--dimethylbenzimidazole phosphoribosyltransferase n=1 Tax=Nocardioides euryhalodurans TaxID=2518370 RepID=A0A4P7GP23_9ACTN|nr:nicotinate-nucleotide--dimethylbenzimidazole phosphoribosyltransferase [Nocardioides euryhalodurans]QBR93975.1 nicotinate-nucleotide--dimethylbenzimidazole phosphoribosyltransferase [Nocardioides euryhalodurans]
MTHVARIDEGARTGARRRVDALAKPLGALGRLEDLAVWLAGVQGTSAPVPPREVSVVVFAGDHGVTGDGAVSAYPRAVTAAMVREFLRGGAAVNVLAGAHGARVRVVDLGVDDDLTDTPPEVRRHKVRRGSGAIQREDALTVDQALAGLAAGRAIADEEVDAGADLLVPGDMGIGNTTVAATLVGTVLGLDADQVVGWGTGVDDETWRHKRDVVAAALERARPYADDPVALLRSVGSADLAAGTGFLLRSAERGVPVLLDGVVSGACALLAERSAPGAVAWWCAGHRSTEPAHRAALASLGLAPLLDLELRLGEASGALTALPLLRTAALLLAGMTTLDSVAPPVPEQV